MCLLTYLRKLYLQEKKGGTNPFAAAPEPAASDSNTPNILDLFGVPEGGATGASAASTTTTAPPSAAAAAAAVGGSEKASDDLLQLAGNPFASVLNATSSNTTASAVSAQSTAASAGAVPPVQPFSSSPFTVAAAPSNSGNAANGICNTSHVHFGLFFWHLYFSKVTTECEKNYM